MVKTLIDRKFSIYNQLVGNFRRMLSLSQTDDGVEDVVLTVVEKI